MGSINLVGVSKSFGDVLVIPSVDLEVNEGEFVVFVGPSGSGKSTLLRLIAGLEEVSKGRIEFNGQDMTNLAPAKRGLAMVFQSYALYPHMSVRENIGFPLKMAGMPKSEIASKVQEAAKILNLVNIWTQAAPAFWWSTSAGCDWSGDCAPTEGLPLRRAPLQLRRSSPDQHALGDHGIASAIEDNHDLRHPRSGRGNDDG